MHGEGVVLSRADRQRIARVKFYLAGSPDAQGRILGQIELLEKGHIFQSRTDTEVIPHLIEEEMKNDLGLQGALLRVLRRLKGSYAIVVLSTHEPTKIYCARNESPLVLGVSDNGTFCASDVPALLPYTNQVNYLRNGEMAILDINGYKITFFDHCSVFRN